MIAFLDLLKEPFTDIIGTNRLPVRLGKAIEGETGVAIAAQAGDGGGIVLCEFKAKGSEGLVGLGSTLLVEDGLEFRFNLGMAFFGKIAEHVFELMDETQRWR